MNHEKARLRAMQALGKLLPEDESGKMEERAIKGYIELLETEAQQFRREQETAYSKRIALRAALMPFKYAWHEFRNQPKDSMAALANWDNFRDWLVYRAADFARFFEAADKALVVDEKDCP